MNEYPSAILFDLDDTLISFDGPCEEAWKICCEDFTGENAYNFTSDELLCKIGKIQKWFWGDPQRHKRGRENIIEARREIVQKAFAELHFNDVEKANQFADRYSACQNELMCLFPKTIETLKRFQNLGIPMGLVTNGSSEGQRAKLERFHLTEFFQYILIDQEVGFSKPDPRIFEYALYLMNLSCRDVWMVGDSLTWDVQAPQSIGIYSIWNDYEKKGLPADSSIVPDRIINDISELI